MTKGSLTRPDAPPYYCLEYYCCTIVLAPRSLVHSPGRTSSSKLAPRGVRLAEFLVLPGLHPFCSRSVLACSLRRTAALPLAPFTALRVCDCTYGCPRRLLLELILLVHRLEQEGRPPKLVELVDSCFGVGVLVVLV